MDLCSTAEVKDGCHLPLASFNARLAENNPLRGGLCRVGCETAAIGIGFA
jgi:hypothetical protein